MSSRPGDVRPGPLPDPAGMELAIEAQDLVKRSGAATAPDGGEPVLLNATRTRHHRSALVRHDTDKAA